MFQMTTVALQAHLKQNLIFSGSLRHYLSPHSHPPNLSLDTQISSHRISKQPQQEVSNTRSGRKLTARCPDNVNAVRGSVARSLKKLSFASSVPAAQLWSFRTYALIKLSFNKLETSDLQFFYCYRICFQEM